jgi:tetratricopeptide (TPR) repeat protein
MSSPLDRARGLCEAGHLDDAWDICESILVENPNHGASLILAAYIAWKANKYVMGYAFAKRAVDVAPQEALAWLNLGLNASSLWRMEEAEVAQKTAVRLASEKEIRGMANMNLAGLCIDFGRFKEAEQYARLALKDAPSSPKAKANLGFGLLGQGKWEGWDFYSYSLGLRNREKMKFGEEPDWDGTPGQTVAFYGEQGVGDELSFASMLPDAIRDCKKVIFSCDKKLEGIFKRSFPNAKVYGTRKAKEGDGVQWDKEDWQMDASLALGELGAIYRKTDESFGGQPYLVADPERRKMWRTLFDGKKKPVIGIAWTGGIENTGRKFRTLTLDMLKMILQSVDAHWVSLQYKDASKEIAEFRKSNPSIDIVQYGFGTLTPDYDDTAALVAECDLVICIQTAVAHLAGALGKDCWVLLPKNSQWRYGESGYKMPWYNSVSVFRQRSLQDWHGPMGEMIGRLRKRYAELEAA